MSVLPVGVVGDAGGYTIPNSLRLRSSASAYLSRTPSVAGNRKTWTWSGWVKRGKLGAEQGIFYRVTTLSSDTNSFGIQFDAGDTLTATGYSTVWRRTNAVYRDASAWYHILVSLDTTQASANNRVRLYVNGVEVTAFSTLNNPTQNADLGVNDTTQHSLGSEQPYTGGRELDGYLTEINFIDGQALTPSSFGYFDSTVTNWWRPKKYTGTYGTNGFYLPFSNGSSLTTLGADRSGNGNNWTLNNISLTAGVTYDWMLDSPTMTASATQPTGNYCTFSPIDRVNNTFATLDSANLKAYGNSATNSCAFAGTIAPTSGKWYFEFNRVGTGNYAYAGAVVPGLSVYPDADDNHGGVTYRSSGNIYSVSGNTTLSTWNSASDIVQFAVDLDNGAIYVGLNGTWLNSGVPTSGSSRTGAVGTFTAGSKAITPTGGGYQSSNGVELNAGQRPWAYTPPTGFKALCTSNLTSTTVTTSGSFTGNANADGPFIWCNGTPETLTINGNAVTFGTHADRLANGFKLRTSSSSYNTSGTNTWTATVLSPMSRSAFIYQNAKGNP